jgi:hypothetical protein
LETTSGRAGNSAAFALQAGYRLHRARGVNASRNRILISRKVFRKCGCHKNLFYVRVAVV